MTRSRSELLAREAADWHHRGIIGAALSESLGKRYDRSAGIQAALTRWAGLLAALLLATAALTMAGSFVKSLSLGGAMLGLVSAGLWILGVDLATAPSARHASTGNALVTVSLAAAFGAVSLLIESLGGGAGARWTPLVLLMIAAMGIATAYRHRLRWPLLLGLLFLFHAAGAWESYNASGRYFASISDPRAMAVIAAACAALGLWHQHAEDRTLLRFAGFGRLYVIFGLLYFNCSLWFLSLPHSENKLTWTLAFAVTCVVQIVLGARLKDGKLTGFGIVFLGINLYTQFFDRFWDRLSAASFFVVAGTVGMLLGYLFERLGSAATAGACRSSDGAG